MIRNNNKFNEIIRINCAQTVIKNNKCKCSANTNKLF